LDTSTKIDENLREHFGPLLTGMKVYKTPAATKTNIQRPEKGEILISQEDQTNFCSGVQIQLHVKHS
jgi:hypothetical protein